MRKSLAFLALATAAIGSVFTTKSVETYSSNRGRMYGSGGSKDYGNKILKIDWYVRRKNKNRSQRNARKNNQKRKK